MSEKGPGLEIAVICQKGGTEKNSEFLRALFSEANGYQKTPKLVPLGTIPRNKKTVAPPGKKKARTLGELGRTVGSLFKYGYPLYKGKNATKPAAVIILWDTDCHPNLQELKRTLCSAVPREHQDSVYIYFAHPEPEIWLLADWDNSFGKGYSAKNAKAIKSELTKLGVHFENLEGSFHFDQTCNTCDKKVSSLIKSAVKNVAGGRYSKPDDTPRLMRKLDWSKVAQNLPAFRPLYNDWLTTDPAPNKQGSCV